MSSSAGKTPSRHAAWYRDTIPAMGPVFLIGSAVYMGLKLVQSQLAHEKFVLDAKARIGVLEQELESLRSARLLPVSQKAKAPSRAAGTPASKSWYMFWK
ncbi:hypothetical protein BDV93DRAFT_518219 [Ceratobasidium sp. AG-I]|nr:hypothetical protein BDV93DRAFT_518219 [Ceratobasidium sp. AG-I]